MQEYKGKIEVTLRQETIDGKPWVIITHRDNGIGWSLEEMPEKNWIKYNRAKNNIEALGGKFEYKATKGVGAVVTIWLPAERFSETLLKPE